MIRHTKDDYCLQVCNTQLPAGSSVINLDLDYLVGVMAHIHEFLWMSHCISRIIYIKSNEIVVTCLWVASITTMPGSRQCSKQLKWTAPQALWIHGAYRSPLQSQIPRVTIAEPWKSEAMTDPAMARLMLEGPKELKAITVNGQIIVETEDDRERCHKLN